MKRTVTIFALVATLAAGEAVAQDPAEPAPGAAETTTVPDDPLGYLTAGVGLPMILHIEGGLYVSKTTTIDVIFGFIVFNGMAGVGGTQWFPLSTGRYNHDLGIGAHAYINVLDEPLDFSSGGERLGLVWSLMFGYAFTLEAGFTVRLNLGALAYDDGGPVVSPSLTGMAGWRF